MDRHGIVLNVEEFQLLQDRFGFLLEHGVMISAKGLLIHDCPQGKVGVLIPLFEEVLRLPTSNFFNMIVDQYGFSIDELTPSTVNKIVDFELICRSLGVSTPSGFSVTSFVRLWIMVENWEDSVLVAGGMSAAWRARGKMAQLFFVRCNILLFLSSLPPPPSSLEKKLNGRKIRVSDESLYLILICVGAKVEISLEMDLRSHYRGRLYHWEVDLVEALTPAHI
ncbi:unnamed protein product [Lactuca saligna]|uniref:Uncharacterized protein n=1 Tax=Lactuca saligna TaxID=75948 RepID=A0AA35Z1M3_LACSI|nr:unnamed protein product [Lactuca saligna]